VCDHALAALRRRRQAQVGADLLAQQHDRHAVITAAFGVFGTGTARPDIDVAAILAGLMYHLGLADLSAGPRRIAG
jgi:hypothetical protein